MWYFRISGSPRLKRSLTQLPSFALTGPQRRDHEKYQEQDMIFERALLGGANMRGLLRFDMDRSTQQSSSVLWTLQDNKVVISSWFPPVPKTIFWQESLLLLEEKQAFVPHWTVSNCNHVLVTWTWPSLLNKKSMEKQDIELLKSLAT